MADGPDRVERLGDLIAYLLHGPRTAAEIMCEVPGYPPGDAGRVLFERDKKLLRDEGIEVDCIEEPGGPPRYRIDPDRFYLPDLGLTDEECAALQLALATVRLEGSDASDLAWRFGRLRATGGLGLRIALGSASVLPTLADAVARRRLLRFRYGGLDREVEPYGVLFREDFWYLSGLDRTRGAHRNFRVDRIEGEVAAGPPGAFERPDGYDPAQALPDQPWLLGAGEPVSCRVWVDALHARRAVADAGGEQAVVERRPDGSVVVALQVRSVEGLRSWLFGMLDHAVVLGPPSVRDEVVAWLTAVAGAQGS